MIEKINKEHLISKLNNDLIDDYEKKVLNLLNEYLNISSDYIKNYKSMILCDIIEFNKFSIKIYKKSHVIIITINNVHITCTDINTLIYILNNIDDINLNSILNLYQLNYIQLNINAITEIYINDLNVRFISIYYQRDIRLTINLSDTNRLTYNNDILNISISNIKQQNLEKLIN